MLAGHRKPRTYVPIEDFGRMMPTLPSWIDFVWYEIGFVLGGDRDWLRFGKWSRLASFWETIAVGHLAGWVRFS